MKKFFFSLVVMLCALIANAQTEVTCDLTSFDGFADWTTSYTAHDVAFANAHATVKFASANKQSSTITDCPVTKGGNVDVVMDGGYFLDSISFTLKQWGTKTQTATLYSGTDGGTTYTSTGVTSDTFKIASPKFAYGTNAARIGFSSTSNQVGIYSIKIYYSKDPGAVASPTFSVAAGSYYSAQSVAIAADAADEGAVVYYSLDGVTYSEYTEGITISADDTLYAYAQVGETKSAVVSAAYVIAKSYASIAEIINVTPSKQPVNLTLTNAIITSVYTTSGGNRNGIYITEGVDTIEIYCINVPEAWEAKGRVSGTISGTWTIYNNTKEICPSGYDALTYTAAPPLEEGKYYFYNKEADKFWGAGNSWGTQASLLSDPVYLNLHIKANTNTYNIESQVTNGGTAYYFNGSYMDNASPIALTITKTDNGYTITNGTSVYGYDGSTTVLSAAATGDNALWEIYSEAEMRAKLEAATYETPVNATWLILDPNFGRNNRYQSSWTITAGNKNLSGGNNINNCAESYHSTFDLSQTLSGVPNGVYSLTAQGFYRQDGTDTENIACFFANNDSTIFPLKTGSESSMSDASVSFTAGNYTIDPIVFEVTDGTIKLGAYNGVNTTIWCIWDNFNLKYYGTDTTVLYIKLKAAIDTYNQSLAAAQAIDQTASMSPVVLAALQSAISTYSEEAVMASPTAESLDEAITALNTAVKNANTSIGNSVAIAVMKDLMDKTNVYTAAAYATYSGIYQDYVARFKSGELTEAVVNPSTIQGWHSANNYDDFLLSAWSVGTTKCNEFEAPLYINTWSTEGNTDGSEFKVPFFEYWTGDANSLGTNTLKATINGVAPGKYKVTALTRVRVNNNSTVAPYGIKLLINDGDSVDVCAGTQVGTTQMYLDNFTATGTVGEDGVLTIQYYVAEDNNISWLSFKNVYYELIPVPVSHTHTIDIAYDRIVNQGYTAESVAYDADSICSLLGLETLSNVSVASVNVTTGALVTDYPTYDGWLNASGDATTWGNGSYVCLKYPHDGNMVICTMPSNEPALGTAYTAKWAMYTATDTVILNVNINFIKAPETELALADKVYKLNVSYVTTDASYTEKIISLASDEISEICAALGLESLSDATVCGYNPTTGLLVSSYISFDGWRDANGDFATWTGTSTVPVCVKYVDGQNYYCYNIANSTAADYKVYWVIANKTTGYLIETTFSYTLPTAINGVETSNKKAEGVYNMNGQKLSGLQKGFNIVDGKKVYIK